MNIFKKTTRIFSRSQNEDGFSVYLEGVPRPIEYVHFSVGEEQDLRNYIRDKIWQLLDIEQDFTDAASEKCFDEWNDSVREYTELKARYDALPFFKRWVIAAPKIYGNSDAYVGAEADKFLDQGKHILKMVEWARKFLQDSNILYTEPFRASQLKQLHSLDELHAELKIRMAHLVDLKIERIWLTSGFDNK